jgi:hypothetical protein
MKMNKITAALVGVGIVSLASVAQANTYIYLTGSTAVRAAVFGALNTSADVFSGASTEVSTGATNGATDFAFEGNITGVGTVDIICHWTGSEAGIAAVAGQTITQPDTTGIPGSNPGNFNLPGVPPVFLVGPADGGNWTTTAPLTSDNGGRGITTPDLAMADTSQAVSLTPQGSFHLNANWSSSRNSSAAAGIAEVAVIPFTFMEGFDASPSISNITTAEANQLINGENPASLITGNVADAGTSVALVGRNKGSGTRVNELLNIGHGVGSAVDQWAFNVSYVANVLTFGGTYTSGQTLQEIVNDGFDSGSGVAKELEVNETSATDGSNPVALLGVVGVSDAGTAHAGTSGTGSGAATYLTYNGVYEGDQSVIQGNYTYWGTEHLLGSVGITGSPLTVGQNLYAGLEIYAAANYGSASGNVTTGSQSILIPLSLMQVTRSGSDSGSPSWVGAGNF